MSVIFKKFNEVMELPGPFRDLDELQTAAITVLRILKVEEIHDYYLEIVENNTPIALNSEEAFKIFEKLSANQTITVNILPMSLKQIDHCGSFLFQPDGTKIPKPQVTSNNTLVLDSVTSLPSRDLDDVSEKDRPQEIKIERQSSLIDDGHNKEDAPKTAEESKKEDPDKTEHENKEEPKKLEESFQSLLVQEVKAVNSSDIQAKLNMIKKLGAGKKTASTPVFSDQTTKKSEENKPKPLEIVLPSQIQHDPQPPTPELKLPKEEKQEPGQSPPQKGLVNKVHPPSKIDPATAKAKIEAARAKKVEPIQANFIKAEIEAAKEKADPLAPSTNIEKIDSSDSGKDSTKNSSNSEPFAPISKFAAKVADSDTIAKIKAKKSALKDSSKASPLITPQKNAALQPIIAGIFAPHSNSPKTPNISNIGVSQPPGLNTSGPVGFNPSNISEKSSLTSPFPKSAPVITTTSNLEAESILKNSQHIETESILKNAQPQTNEVVTPTPNPDAIQPKRRASVKFADSVNSSGDESKKLNELKKAEESKRDANSKNDDFKRSEVSSTTSPKLYNDSYFKTLRKEKSLRVNTEEAHDRLAHRFGNQNYFEEKPPLKIPDSHEAIPEFSDSRTESPRTQMETSQRLEYLQNNFAYQNFLRQGSADTFGPGMSPNKNDLLLSIPRDSLKNLMMEIFHENMGYMADQIKDKINGNPPSLTNIPPLKRNASNSMAQSGQLPSNLPNQALELSQMLAEKMNHLNFEQRKLVNDLLGGIPEKISRLFGTPKFLEESQGKNFVDLKEPMLKKSSSKQYPPADHQDFEYKIEEKPCPRPTSDVVEYQKTLIITNSGSVAFPKEMIIRPRNADHGNAKKIPPLEPGKSVLVILNIQLPRKAGIFETEWEFVGQQGILGRPVSFKLNVEDT